MAIGAVVQGICSPGEGLGSGYSGWVVANEDLETADTAELLSPANITRATFHWVKRPASARRVLLRGRNNAAATTVTTSPIVQIWGAYSDPDSAGAFSNTPTAASGTNFMRLDNADSGATGLTLTLAATGNLEDALFEYGDLEATTGLAGLDCKNARYIGMLVSTAANVTGGAAHAVAGQMLFME